MEASLEDCVASWDGERLRIENSMTRRVWRRQGQSLYAESICDLRMGKQWLARPSPWASPSPACSIAADETCHWYLETECGRAGPTQEPSLHGALVVEGKEMSVRYEFQLFPSSAGVALRVRHTGGEAVPAESGKPEDRAVTGVELADTAQAESSLERADALELFELAPPHLRLLQVELRDRTDLHNELVFEREWLLHPNEDRLALQGNLFVLEDTLDQAGLIFLKHAPLPWARPLPVDVDFELRGRGACYYEGEAGLEPAGVGRPREPLAYQVGCFGHGADASGEGYVWAVIPYLGGESGRVAALQHWQRQWRRFEPARDVRFLSNTWGDRSRDARLCESFMLWEIEAAARLGVEVAQIDDGWQRGITSNSTAAHKGGVWEGFWASDAAFWQPHPERFPRGLEPLVEAARERGLRLGLWFAPDSADDFANWQRDVEAVLELRRRYGVDHFKIDGVKARTRLGERRLASFFRAVLEASAGAVVFDLDVTAEVRPGYFGQMEAGPVFVENRYTDFHRYWPHQTLRNLWKLARYVDPARLRIEFLNTSRHANLYEGDPLGPGQYAPECLLATTLFANPLGWFEVSSLPGSWTEPVARLASVWKEHRERLFAGTLYPVGSAPDGCSWTGFASVAEGGASGYLLAFRERHPCSRGRLSVPGLSAGAATSVSVLAGAGSVALGDSVAEVEVKDVFGFVLARWG